MAMTIVTKYLGATNTKGSRIKATTYNGDERIDATVNYRHNLDSFENHRQAARDLLSKLTGKGLRRDDVNHTLTEGYLGGGGHVRLLT